MCVTIQSKENCSCCACPVNFALLGYYTAFSGNFLLTFQDNLSVPSSGVKVTDSLSQSVSKKLLYLLCNNPEECISLLLHGGSLKSHNACLV